jgi:hypothetical protein
VAGPGVATFSLAGNPGPPGNALAAGDLVAVRETDGVTRLYTVSSLSAGTLVLTTNLIAGVAVGSKAWNLGNVTDVDPFTGLAHDQFDLPAGVVTALESEVGIISSHLPDQPLLLDITQLTNAGLVVHANWPAGQVEDLPGDVRRGEW